MPQSQAAAAALYRPRPASNQLNPPLPFACRGRGLCPSCGQKRALVWAERMVDEGELRAMAQERTAGRAGHREAVGSEACLEAARERATTGGLPIVPYRQLVFTIPRNLRRAFLFDRSLYGDFCRIAYASTGDFLRRQAAGQFYGVEKAVPAMVASPQSFGNLIVQQPRS